jgi:RNA polymerase sigma-70 factor (ECF subfamily)
MKKNDQVQTPNHTNHHLIEGLLPSHRRFLSFLRNRVGDEATAEDILQMAYVKGLERASQVRDEKNIVAWFYRLLRNAIVDYYRQKGSETRVIELFGKDYEEAVDSEFHAEVCACIHDVLKTLNGSYAEAIQRVDLEEMPVDEYARQQAISQNNAWVRLHRGRKALQSRLTRLCGVCARHGCLECHCRT